MGLYVGPAAGFGGVQGQVQMNNRRNPPPPPLGGPGGRSGRSLTPQQWAQREAQRLIDAQVAAIQEQQRIYLEELNKQAQLRASQGRALASWLQGQNFPGRIQGLYQTAGSDITGYAKGFSESMQGIANADAAVQTNMLSGTGQEGAVRNEGQNMGDVLYGAYGWSPAKKFAETGAAFASDAAMQPSFAARIGDLEAGKIQQEGLDRLVEFARMLTEARSGKAQTVRELLERRQAMAWEKEDRSIAAQDRQRDWFLKMAAYYNQIGDDKRAAEYLRLAQLREQRYANKDRGLDANGRLLPGWKKSPAGNVPPGSRYNPNTGQIEKNSGSGSGSGSKVDWGGLQQAMAGEDFTVTEQSKPQVVNGVTIPGEKVTRAMTYKEAYAHLWVTYSGSVTNKGRLRRLINRILRAKGITKPGVPPYEDRTKGEGVPD